MSAANCSRAISHFLASMKKHKVLVLSSVKGINATPFLRFLREMSEVAKISRWNVSIQKVKKMFLEILARLKREVRKAKNKSEISEELLVHFSGIAQRNRNHQLSLRSEREELEKYSTYLNGELDRLYDAAVEILDVINQEKKFLLDPDQNSTLEDLTSQDANKLKAIEAEEVRTKNLSIETLNKIFKIEEEECFFFNKWLQDKLMWERAISSHASDSGKVSDLQSLILDFQVFLGSLP